MFQKLPLGSFRWVEETSQFHEDFIKIYIEDHNIGYYIEADVQYPEKLHKLDSYSPFLPERMKIEKVGKLFSNLHDEKECYSHKKYKTSFKSLNSFLKKAQSLNLIKRLGNNHTCI